MPLSPVSTTSTAVRSGGIRRAWSTTPMCVRSSRRSVRPSRRPNTSALPELGWRVAPATDSVVDLPAPLGPSSAQRSPGQTCQLRSVTR